MLFSVNLFHTSATYSIVNLPTSPCLPFFYSINYHFLPVLISQPIHAPSSLWYCPCLIFPVYPTFLCTLRSRDHIYPSVSINGFPDLLHAAFPVSMIALFLFDLILPSICVYLQLHVLVLGYCCLLELIDRF